jgi:hypothetical protein
MASARANAFTAQNITSLFNVQPRNQSTLIQVPSPWNTNYTMHASLIATLVLVISTVAPAFSAPLEYAVVPLNLATLSDDCS